MQKLLIIISLAFLAACSKPNPKPIPFSEKLVVQGDASLGVVDYGKSVSKTLLFTNNESGTLNLVPSLSGVNASDFGLAQLNCTSVLVGKSCKVVINFQSVGKVAGVYSATLTVGSQEIPVSAEIESVPNPVVELRVNGVAGEVIDMGVVTSNSAKIFTVLVTNKSPVVATGTLSSSNAVYNKVYSGCDNISLKPNQTCMAKFFVQGQSVAGDLSTNLIFGSQSFTVSLENQLANLSANIQPLSATLELGDIVSSGDRLIKVIVLTNTGTGVGGLSDLQLPPGYSYLHDNCGTLKPKDKCTLRVSYVSNDTKGQQTGDITFNDSSISTVVNRVDSMDNLSFIEISGLPSEALADSCHPVTVSFFDGSHIGFIVSTDLNFSMSQDFFSDASCSENKVKSLPAFSHEVSGYVKIPDGSQLLSVDGSFNSVSGSQLVQVYSHLSASVVVDNLIAGQTTTLNISGGKLPYSVSSSGGVSVVDNVVSGLISGANSITVQDSFGQEVIVPITVSSDINLTAGSCSYNVPESVSCALSVSGGAGNLSFSTDIGTVDNLGNFTGQCINNLGSSLVTVEDEYGNSKELSLSYPCIYKSCSQIKAEGYGSADGNYWLDLDELGSGEDPFLAYCGLNDNDGGGWTMIASGGSGCVISSVNTMTEKRSGLSLSTCGYLPNDLVKKISQNISSVRLRAGVSHNSFDDLRSSGVNTINALKNGTNWHGAEGEFSVNSGSAWQWGNMSGCATPGATSWPNMFHSCNNGNGVHWLVSGTATNHAKSYNQPNANIASSTWVKTIYYYHPRTCQEAMDRGTLNLAGNTGNGTYRLDVDGYGHGAAPVDTLCDMETTPGTAWTGVATSNLNSVKMLEGKQFVKLTNYFSTSGVNSGTRVIGIFRNDSISVNQLIGKPVLNTTNNYTLGTHPGGSFASGYNYMGGVSWFSNQGIPGPYGTGTFYSVVFANGVVGSINYITPAGGSEHSYIYYFRYNYTLWERP